MTGSARSSYAENLYQFLPCYRPTFISMSFINQKVFISILCLVAMLSGPQASTASDTSREMAAADSLFRAKKWKEAAAAYETIVGNQPSNGAAWHQLAMSRYSLGDWNGAIAAFQKGIALSNDPIESFNLACVFARKGDKDSALASLSKAVNHPKVNVQLLNLNDPDLQTLRGEPRFQTLVEQVERGKFPCMFTPEARQFDFWIGEWDCFNPDGRKDGTSIIERVAGGCGILENWTSTFGGSGKSINFYDAADRKWYQYWIGQNGVPLRLAGAFTDGAMHYEGKRTQPDGSQAPTRLTFARIDDDTVRQFSETSVDGGKTWKTDYDYKYVRKAKDSVRTPAATPH